MKRKLIASIVGIAATSAMVAAYGQGQITFFNYASGETGTTASPAAPVTFGAGTGGLQGTGVGSQFSAELLYSYTGMGSTPGQIAGPIAGFNVAQDNSAAAIATFYPASAGGLFVYNGTSGALVTIPGDPVGGPAVTFEVYVSGTLSAVNYTGASASFTQVLSNPVGDMFNNGNLTPGAVLTSFTVVPTPEPSTIALGGLGIASLLALRRRK